MVTQVRFNVHGDVILNLYPLFDVLDVVEMHTRERIKIIVIVPEVVCLGNNMDEDQALAVSFLVIMIGAPMACFLFQCLTDRPVREHEQPFISAV
jgi:hypothetical protein